MVRLIHKTKIAAIATLAVATPVFVAPLAKADNPQSVDFNVNVAEVLTVSITDPTSWASGELSNYNTTTEKWESDFLRNKVTVSAATNNAVGVTVSMYTTNTSLINRTNNNDTIPTLSAATQKGSIDANHWGYSLTDTDAGTDNSVVYSPLQTTAIPVFTTTTETDKSSGSQAVFFGAKADTSSKSGTYAQTVYFAAVTGTVDTDNPAVPVNPSTPTPVDNTPTYAGTAGVGTGGQTTYTTRTTSGSGTSSVSGQTKTTTSEVSKGNTTSSYSAPAGVTTSSGIDGGSTIATALGVAAGVAAVSGITFFALAKRRKDDDEDE